MRTPSCVCIFTRRTPRRTVTEKQTDACLIACLIRRVFPEIPTLVVKSSHPPPPPPLFSSLAKELRERVLFFHQPGVRNPPHLPSTHIYPDQKQHDEIGLRLDRFYLRKNPSLTLAKSAPPPPPKKKKKKKQQQPPDT